MPTSIAAPILGSWFVQVAFKQGPNTGFTASTVETFTANGGVTEENPLNPSQANSGFWRVNADCSYSVTLTEFTYDPTTHGVSQVVVPNLTYVLENGQLASTSAITTVYIYDPATRALQSSFVVGSATNPVTVSTGQRFSVGWTPPNPL